MSEKIEKRTEVNVHKNELPLQPGQSVSSFTREIGDMVRGHLFKKLGLDKIQKKEGDHAHVWVNDVFAEQVVAEVSLFQKAKSPSHTNTFYAVGYGRDNLGAMKFGDPVEVVRRVTYVPKAPTEQSVTKCDVIKNFWAGVL